MKQCKLCGKKGLFLKLTKEGTCYDCIRLNEINKRTEEAVRRLNKLNFDEKNLEDNIKKRKEDIEFLRNNKNSIILEYRKEMLQKYDDEINKKQYELNTIMSIFNDKEKLIFNSGETIKKNEKQIESLKQKIAKIKNLYDAIQYANEHMQEINYNALNIYLEEVKPTVEIKLHYMDVADLRKKYNENKKLIQEVLSKYESRYTTKANKTIYQIMVLALEAEIQNILVDLKYGRLEEGKQQVIDMTRKYISIACEGNQSIVNTLTSFIGQIESLYLKAVEIEYEYYTKKEKIKEEQRALREQLRQEALERKLLAEQQAQIEKEESKYITEIESLKTNLETVEDEKKTLLELRIKELEELLNNVQEKKEEIVNLQNGKAGYVYVISNLGSFGDDVFKIGMTRRLNPQERVDELGSASVPFPFDVHSFIFSDDAVELEHNLHITLNDRRVNRVNLRKEFFKVNIEELEEIVLKYDPTAEFKRTMLAEQFRQSLTAGDNKFIYDIEEEINEEIENEEEVLQ